MLIVGVRLEQAIRHCALVVVRRNEWLEGDFDAKRMRWPTEVNYDVVHIVRWPRGQDFASIIEAIGGLMQEIPGKPALLVDITATGRPPVELMIARGLKPYAIQIAESGQIHPAKRTLVLPRTTLVTMLALTMGQDRIAIARGLPEADTLSRQLQSYRVKPEPDDQTDLAIACALAVWWASSKVRSQVHQPPPPRVPIVHRWPTFDEALKMRQARGRLASGAG